MKKAIRMKKKNILLLSIAGLWTMAGFAQAAKDSARIARNLTIDEVVVTGTRNETDIRHLPMTISVVNRKVLEQRFQPSVLSALTEQVPGLFATSRGIMGYGVSTGAAGVFAGESYPVATKAEVKKGAAVLLSDLEGKDVQAYAIEIESLEKNGGRQHKDMNIRIMDERLLALTGGIVQGMSGSPILQDGKLVGAVTHVTLADPTKGYGIFMENMAA